VWIAKNNPAWDEHIELYEETKMDDNFDPQWEATIRGDKEGLCLELQSMAQAVDDLDTTLHSLMRQIHDLRDGLQRHSTTSTDNSPVAGDVRSGSLRVSTSVRDKLNNPPTAF
jgi:hypothetical protein